VDVERSAERAEQSTPEAIATALAPPVGALQRSKTKRLRPDAMTFRIAYSSPTAHVPRPTRYEGYDLESAMHDFLPAGPSARIEADGYGLELQGEAFVELVEGALEVAERLAADVPPPSQDGFRFALPGLPADAHISSMSFPALGVWVPVLVFARTDDEVDVYTRTFAETAGFPVVVRQGRDRAEPVTLPRRAVIDELAGFVRRYLDDLVAAFPFIREDAAHRDWTARLP
jgi:hypothetical protein